MLKDWLLIVTLIFLPFAGSFVGSILALWACDTIGCDVKANTAWLIISSGALCGLAAAASISLMTR